MPKLKNVRHEAYCQEFLIDLNATQAYLRTYKTKNPNSARKNSSKLMANADIQQRIQELADSRAENTKITAEQVLRDIHDIATFDIAEIYDDDGSLKNIHDIPVRARKAISSIKINELWDGFGKERIQIGETKEVKSYDKLKALEDLGRHLKLFTDKIEVSGKIENLAGEVSKARKRASLATKRKSPKKPSKG